MKTISEFCTQHDAYGEGRKWALTHCTSMQEVWETAKPEWVIWVATCPGVLTDRELRLFAVWSARQVQHLMTDPRSINALDVAERHVHGQATDEELSASWEAAKKAAWAAERIVWEARAAWAAAKADFREAAWAARTAALDAARAAGDAARYSAEDAAKEAARAAACAAKAAARDAARDAAWDAAQAAQAEWLRQNAKPNFN